jgi:hypothetical protein
VFFFFFFFHFHFLRFFCARSIDVPTSTYRRHVAEQQSMEGSPEQEEEFETVGNFQPFHWQNLMLKARLHWARYFSFVDEDTINMVLKEGMGEDIMAPENSMAYDLAFSKVRAWGRQWQCETIKRFVAHVSPSFPQGLVSLQSLMCSQVKEVYEADKEKVSDLTPSGVRNHFYRGLNEPVMKYVFHVLNPDIDTSEIIISAASALYCTLFSNMCAYVLQHRVKLDGRTAAADEFIFRNFTAIPGTLGRT